MLDVLSVCARMVSIFSFVPTSSRTDVPLSNWTSHRALPRRLDHVPRAERKIQDGVFGHFRSQAENHGDLRPFAGLDVADWPK